MLKSSPLKLVIKLPEYFIQIIQQLNAIYKLKYKQLINALLLVHIFCQCFSKCLKSKWVSSRKINFILNQIQNVEQETTKSSKTVKNNSNILLTDKNKI